MNRTTALLLALGLLVAHVLTLGQDPSGDLGTAADRAYVALRLGRNWVFEGGPTWNPTGVPIDSYPSWGWVTLIAFAERVYWPSLQVVQIVGALGAFATVIAVARFSPDRLTGVIGPFLVVLSGTTAAAALNGTEWSCFTLACVLALLAAEEGRPRLLVGSILAACWLRPEGLLLLVGLALVHRTRRDEHARIGARPYLWASAGAAALLGLHALVVGTALPPSLSNALTYDTMRVGTGVDYAASFFLKAGAPFLTAVPLVWLLERPAVGGRAARALFLGLGWVTWVAWSGGDELPFWAALLPALPMLAIAIQDALTAFVYARSRVRRTAGWMLFLMAMVASAVASKQRVDIGPVPLRAIQAAWQGRPGERLTDELDVGVSRLGQLEALVAADRLRCLGIFVRDRLPADCSVLSPWPGIVGYLSRKSVYDLGGRALPLEGDAPGSWYGPTRVDLVRVLEQRPDFILPSLQLDGVPAGVRAISDAWIERYDIGPDTPERRRRIQSLFDAYVPLAVPIPVDSAIPDVDAPEPFMLLRHRSGGELPRLALELDGDRLQVDLRHKGHRVVAGLQVELTDAEGTIWSLRPTGAFECRPGLIARQRLLIYPSGRRPMRLIDARLPSKVEVQSLRARLVPPRPVRSAAEVRRPNEWDVELKLSPDDEG